MKKIFILILALLFSLTFIVAQEIYTEPYNDLFTLQNQYNQTYSQIETALGINSCYVESNWQSKNCHYAYFCYAILPSTSTNIADSLKRECLDITLDPNAQLVIKDFLPPKGILYYVVTFITKVNYTYNDVTQKWDASAEIPTSYVKAHSIRSVCPQGQMLDFDPAIGQYKCYLAKRMCLDTMQTGLCTNVYILWALDKNEDGNVSDLEMHTGSSLCADRPIPNYPLGDGICDLTRDLECVDVCSQFSIVGGEMTCTLSGANGLCDEWDMAAWYGCWDDVLSPNSKICDVIDSSLCSTIYDPVCVAKTQGTIIGGQTYPNDCFAKSKGYNKCAEGTIGIDCYVIGACEPSIVQCYVPEDCPIPNVCVGGSSAGISALCLNYMCSYSGACGTLTCATDADCSGLTMPCVGVIATCQGGYCTIQGQCLTKPEPEKFNLWALIQSVWATFWAWVKSLFGV